MAKKIRFALIMENGVEVRDLEGLRNNFSFPKVIEYINNGKLVIWLRDRYENQIADDIEGINLADNDLEKKLCEIFEIELSEKLLEEAKEVWPKTELSRDRMQIDIPYID